MIFRQATHNDLYREDFRSLVLRGLAPKKIGLEPSWPKLLALASRSFDGGFWMAAEEDGIVKAHLCAVIVPNAIFEGDQCMVIAWYSEVPGAGMKLYGLFADWLKTAEVTSAAITTNMDARLSRILIKRGWTMCPNYLKVT